MTRRSSIPCLAPIAAVLALWLAPAGCALEVDAPEPVDEAALDDETAALVGDQRGPIAAACTTPPPETFVDSDYVRCTGDGPEYRFSWDAVQNPCVGPVTYDVDYRYGAGAWNNLFQNGNTSVNLIAFPPSTLGVRVRACNQYGCSVFHYNAGSQRPTCRGGGN